MRTILFFLLCTPLFAGTPLEDLRGDIDEILNRIDSNVHVGIEVVSLKTRQILYEKNKDKLFVPASNLKVFTGAAGLAILGVDYRFETDLLFDAEKNLYLRGSGDPSLNRYDLESLVHQLKMLQVQEVGNIFVDNFAFDEISQGPGWMWDEPAEYWNSPMDALTVDHNVMNIWVVPGAPPKTILDPPLNQLVVDNQVALGKTVDLKAERGPISSEKRIFVEGTVTADHRPVELKVIVPIPSQYAGEFLSYYLRKAGIAIKGEIVRKLTPASATLIASHASNPLSQLLLPLMKDSDNLYADCLFKKIGQFSLGAPGTWQKGALTVRDFLKKDVGIDVSRIVFLDGSGLSRYNLIAPHNFVQFLMWMHEQFPYTFEFFSSLPISGVDGTLSTRMLSAKNKVRAKTGSMTGLSGISGYVMTKDKEVLAFSIMLNGFVRPVQDYKTQIEDEICIRLSQFSRN